jgi:hypothetical protein
MRAGQIEEDRADLLQPPAAPLQRLDRIGKGWRLRIVLDPVHLGPFLRHGRLECGAEMLRADLVERRRLERRFPGLEQRVAVEVGHASGL